MLNLFFKRGPHGGGNSNFNISNLAVLGTYTQNIRKSGIFNNIPGFRFFFLYNTAKIRNIAIGIPATVGTLIESYFPQTVTYRVIVNSLMVVFQLSFCGKFMYIIGI